MAAFWEDETNITIHRVGLHESWPQVLQPLAERLSQPKLLPSWTSKGPYPFVSDHAEHLVSELKHACGDFDEAESTPSVDDVVSSRLIKVFDTVMCTTTSLRRYTDHNGFDDSGVTSVYILALIRQIVFAYWPYLSVFEGARFVFPRHPTYGSNALMKFTDTSRSARLLIMLRTSSSSHEKSAESEHASDDHPSPDASDLVSETNSPFRTDNVNDGDCPTESESESDSSDVDDGETSSEAASSKLDRWTVDEIALGYRLRRRSPVSELTHVSEGTGCKSSVDLDEDDSSQEQDQPIPHSQLDPRLDRHLLQCLSVEDPVYISTLCVGSLDEIWGIMASTLYQRWALGILEPVIGITFESGFTVAQIVFGWLEDCDVPFDLPKVHIAFGVAGAYDLRNPLASLLFAESISSLGERMGMMEPSFLTLSENSQLSPTSWRSDSFGQSPVIDERDSHQKVKSWLDESSIYWRPDQMSSESASQPRRSPIHVSSTSPDSSAASSTSNPNTKVSKTEQSKSNPSASRSLTSKSKTSNTDDVPDSTSQSIVSIVLSDDQGKATTDKQSSVGALSTRSKRFSASAFAAASNDAGAELSGCVIAWMGYRQAFSYPFPVLKPGDLPSSLPSPLQDYNDYTAFYSPTWFDQLDEVQVEDDLTDMLTELQMNCQARDVAVRYGRLPLARKLPLVMSTFIRSRLSIILRAAKNARRKKEAARYETVSEAESRIDWDNLILECAVGPAVDTKLEQTIKLSRNLDLGLSKEDRRVNLGLAVDWIQDWSRFSQNDAEVKVVNSNAPPAALEAAEAEQNNLMTMAEAGVIQAMTMNTRMDNFRLKSLANFEPKTGKCDAVVRLSIPGALAKQHVGKFITADFVQFSTSRTSPKKIDTIAPPIIPRPTDIKDFSDLMASSRLQAAIVGPYASPRLSVESVAVALSHTRISDSGLSALAALPAGSSTAMSAPSPSSNTPPPTTSLPNANPATIIRHNDDLDFSILNVEYKKLLETIVVTGVNQGRLYGVSFAKYLEALGIEEFPSFTLIVEGSIGVVTCAYVETMGPKMRKVTKLYEKNAISFDISNPLDALNFATFSHFIATTHAEKLRARFEEVKDTFYARCKSKDETLRWNMAHQSSPGGLSHLRVPSVDAK